MPRPITKPTNPKFKTAELQKLDYGELENKLNEYKENLMRARFELATAALSNTSLLKKLRHEIARTETIMHQLKPGKK